MLHSYLQDKMLIKQSTIQHTPFPRSVFCFIQYQFFNFWNQYQRGKLKFVNKPYHHNSASGNPSDTFLKSFVSISGGKDRISNIETNGLAISCNAMHCVYFSIVQFVCFIFRLVRLKAFLCFLNLCYSIFLEERFTNIKLINTYFLFSGFGSIVLSSNIISHSEVKPISISIKLNEIIYLKMKYKTFN